MNIKSILYEIYRNVKNFESFFKILEVKKRDSIKLEIGSGKKKGLNGWTTIDSIVGADLCFDLRNGIPFKDNSVDKIYSSHLFEHLTYHDMKILLKECKRVLKPNGTIDICVPNSRLYIEAYVNNNKAFLDEQDYYKPSHYQTTKIDLLNYIAYMNGEHKHMFDEENLVFIIENAGFKNAKLREFDKEVDRIDRIHESIYAIGQK